MHLRSAYYKYQLILSIEKPYDIEVHLVLKTDGNSSCVFKIRRTLKISLFPADCCVRKYAFNAFYPVDIRHNLNKTHVFGEHCIQCHR